MFYVVGIFRTLGLGDSISNDYERTALRRQEEQPGYTEALQQRASSLNIKRLLKKTGYPKLRNLVFYVWGDARIWAH